MQPIVGWFESPDWNWTSSPRDSGWYSVTSGTGVQQRFWDGTEWTAERNSEPLQEPKTDLDQVSDWNPGGWVVLASVLAYQNRVIVLDWLTRFVPPVVAIGVTVLLVIIAGVFLGLGFRVGWGFASRRLKS
jgi:hypothetical protein